MDQINLFKEYEKIFEEKDSSEKKKKEFQYSYSPFAIQDAIGEKDVKKIWIEYQKLVLSGVEVEDLIHKIISKARDILAIKKGASKEALGIKNEYPYNKSKRDSRNWKEEEIERFYTKLVSVYHQSRMSPADGIENTEEIGLALERALLSI